MDICFHLIFINNFQHLPDLEIQICKMSKTFFFNKKSDSMVIFFFIKMSMLTLVEVKWQQNWSCLIRHIIIFKVHAT